MMKRMDEDAAPVYRASPRNRLAAWVVLAGTVGVPLFVFLTGGGAPPVAVVLSIVVALLAAAALRFQVRAEPNHLVVCWGGRVRRIPWAQVKGFGVDRAGRDVYVVLADKRKKRLPLVDVSTRRVAATDVRDALQRYWKTHRR
jgi:hypothetical protein